MNTLDKLRERLKKTKGIPALEHTVSEILEALYDDRYNTRKLVGLITSDVSLTQKVLKLVNSAMYSTFSKDVSTVTDALKFLGTGAVIHLTLGALLITKSELLEDEELSKTILASEIAKTISEGSGQENVSIASLLYNLGKLICSKYLKEECSQVDSLVINGKTFEEAEIEVLGMTYQEIGVELAKDWKLPKAIISILDNTGDEDIIKSARFSNIASSLIHEGRSEEIEKLITLIDITSKNIERLYSVIREKKREIVPKTKHVSLFTKAELNIRTEVVKIKHNSTPLTTVKPSPDLSKRKRENASPFRSVDN